MVYKEKGAYKASSVALQGPCPGTPRPITGSWPAHRIDGHRLRRRPGTTAGALPWYSPTVHQLLAGTTGSMATGCAGDLERLQGPALVLPADHQLLAGTTGSMATGCAGDQERLQG
ncbi:hypothetical protein, partial [Aeromonas sp. 700722]|uniref:hypothetical protein n=1 Tax=Aeromonas sp. 700722 TaxID=2712057 RepID=UPI003B9F0B59